MQAPLGVDGKVMQYMITRAALLLRAYPTTLEQDQQILKETTVSGVRDPSIFGLFYYIYDTSFSWIKTSYIFIFFCCTTV